MRGEKFGINCQWRNELFMIVMFHISLGKSVRICKLRKDCLVLPESVFINPLCAKRLILKLILF
jgi:hypothetical protein